MKMAITAGNNRKGKKKNKKKNARSKIEIKRTVKSLNWQKFKTEKLSNQKTTPESNGKQITQSTQDYAPEVKSTTKRKSSLDKKSKPKLKTKQQKSKMRTHYILNSNPQSLLQESKLTCVTPPNPLLLVQPVVLVPVPNIGPVPVQNTSPAHVHYNVPVVNKFQSIENADENVAGAEMRHKQHRFPAHPVRMHPFRLAVRDYNFFTQPGVVSAGGVQPRVTQDVCVAMDCEMVGIGTGRENMLARVSLVDMSGQCIYDTFVYPQAPVVDFRTHVSGVRPENLYQGADFNLVRRVVATLISNRILVGHAISNDLKVLFFKYPKQFIRDTASYKPFKERLKTRSSPSLKRLAKEILNIGIQESEHSSIEDARAAMRLYVEHREEWEKSLQHQHS